MDGIYLICFGDSEKNARIAIKEKIIGVNGHPKFDETKEAFFLVKKNGEWIIIAKANIKGETEKNPFEKPNKYSTYEVCNLVTCEGFGISSLLKEQLGGRYGLVLRTPKLITAESFIGEIMVMFDKNQK